MPTYDYECKACGHKFEKFQSITAQPIRKCPDCKTNQAKRLIGMGAGIIFKGSGFYQTDYRSSSYNEAAKKDKAATSGESASSDSSAKKSSESTTKKSSTDSSKADTKKADTVTPSAPKKTSGK